MCDLNTTTIVGRLVRDPEMRYSQSGTAVGSFCIAVNHRYQDKDRQWRNEPAFVPCVSFGHEAGGLGGCRKGDCVLAIGRLRTDTWEKNGASHSRLVLVAEKVRTLQGAAPKAESSQPNPPVSEEVWSSVPF